MRKIYRYLFFVFFSTNAMFICAQTQKYKGWPAHHTIVDLKAEFKDPPKGYGEVPFYWWNGDTLTKERLSYQLDLLSNAAVDGFSVSYMHTNPKVDIDINKHGYGGFGRADEGKPAIFSSKWWNLWDWFATQCADRRLGVGLDDYVIGREGNGFYMDDLLSDTSFTSYQGRLMMKAFSKQDKNFVLPHNSVSTYERNDSLFVVYTTPSFELHPDYGKRLVEVYYKNFESKMSERGRYGLNYFFQDELKYDLTLHSWCEDMQQQFLRRKGYDVTKYLAALFIDIGDITPKIRLDYAQVLTELAEERYFKPIYDWHNSRGLIYGCDNYGRGLYPDQYLDYFRAISWYTAPGNDAPALGSSFRQTKVSSSITHVYNRPRTWLEAFHSMGWNSNGEWLTQQLDLHLIAGGNLLCLHGLDYTTHGGWWEWAPPCFHFRMPYWPHMKHWLRYAERMTFLLSQGSHVCDVAVLYPSESVQAYPGFKPENMWKVTDELTKSGIDYDFLDYQSLQKASICDGKLKVGQEDYRILLVADGKAMHQETLDKIREFTRHGGIVLFTGEEIKATTLSGANNKYVETELKAIMKKGGKYLEKAEDIVNYISKKTILDFHPSSGIGKVLHRRIGDHDVYMVMNVADGDTLFFRSRGQCELWNANDGSAVVCPVLRQDSLGTLLQFRGETGRSSLFVFSPGPPQVVAKESNMPKLVKEEHVNGKWTTTLLPTMDNRWGDFRLPATDEVIGVEAREIKCEYVDIKHYRLKNTCDTFTTIYGYAPYLEVKNIPDSMDWRKEAFKEEGWTPYCYSWQYGVKDSPGSQGYHGLKGKLDDRFIILDKDGTLIFRTRTYAPQKGDYDVWIEGVKPNEILLDGQKVQGLSQTLAKGWHSLIMIYTHTHNVEYSLEGMKGDFLDKRERSAVVIYPHGSKANKSNNPYGKTIAMKWYGSNHLDYDVHGGQKGFWKYTFETAPGTTSLKMRLAGNICNIKINENKLPLNKLITDNNGFIVCPIENPQKGISTVTITSKPDRGHPGAAFFIEPVRMTTGEGEMEAGNWTYCGAMKFYSGGVCYRKKIHISQLQGYKLILSLGKVDATCEIRVNGKKPCVIVSPPYKVDITEFIHEGDNDVEVLVYSTLSNHYQTIPSPYRGKPVSGLLGPVTLQWYRK